MEHLTLPSVGASFKKWECFTPILAKALAHSPNFQKKKKKKESSLGKARRRPAVSGRLWFGDQ
jgi:hypothetical protein